MAITLIQEGIDSDASLAEVTLGTTPLEGTLLVAVVGTRGTSTGVTGPAGFTELGPVVGPSFDGGKASLYYKVSGAAESATISASASVASAITMWVGEYGGVGAFVDSDSADDVAASTTLTAGPSSIGSGNVLAFAVFNQSARGGGPAGGVAPDFVFDDGWTREININVNDSGPALAMAWRVYPALAGDVEVDATATNNDGYGWLLATFEVDELPPDVYADWDGDGFSTNDAMGEYVTRWRITRGSSAEITGGAQIGQASLLLKNPGDIFNPENASSPFYPNVRDGVPLWIGVGDDGRIGSGTAANGLFGGRIKDVTLLAQPGFDDSPLVEITAEDELARLGRARVSVAMSTTRSHEALREAILDDAPLGTAYRDLAPEIETMPLSGADGFALGLLEQINQATGTRHYVHPADVADDWFAYTTRDRQWHLSGTVQGTVTASQHDQVGSWRYSADTVINEQRVSVVPIRFASAATEVWRWDVVPFTFSGTVTRVVDFDDYVKSPVIDINTSGTTVTSTLTSFGDSALITLVSAGTSTVKSLQIEGALARRAPTETYVAVGTASQADPRGPRFGSDVSSPYVGVMASAKGLGDHIVWRYQDPQLRPTLTVHNWMPYQFQLDLFDLIAFTSAQLGVTSRLFEIVGLTHEGNHAGSVVHHATTYVLQECRVQTTTNWFTADVHAPNGSAILGY